MTLDEIIKTAKDLITNEKIQEAKKFIEEHKDDLGSHYDTLVKLVSSNAGGILNKAKDLFSK